MTLSPSGLWAGKPFSFRAKDDALGRNQTERDGVSAESAELGDMRSKEWIRVVQELTNSQTDEMETDFATMLAGKLPELSAKKLSGGF